MVSVLPRELKGNNTKTNKQTTERNKSITLGISFTDFPAFSAFFRVAAEKAGKPGDEARIYTGQLL